MSKTKEATAAKPKVTGARILVPKRGADVVKLPNAALFSEVRSMEVPGGRKATQLADGSWVTPLGHKATAGHTKLAQTWADRCFPAQDMFGIVTADSKYLHDESVRLIDLQVRAGTGSKDKPDNFLYLSNGSRSRLTPQGIKTLVEIIRPERVYGEKLQDDVDKGVGLGMTTLAYQLANGWTKDAAKYINHEISQRLNRNGGRSMDKMVMIRKRDDAVVKGLSHARALVSSKYGVYNNAQVIEDLLAVLPTVGMSDLLCDNWHYDGDVMSGSFLIPDSMHKHPNHGIGFTLRNSEDTRFRIQMQMYLYQAICVNGCRWGRQDATIEINEVHSGAQFRQEVAAKMKGYLQAVLSNGESLIRQMEMAAQIGMPVTIEQLITSLANRKDLGLTTDSVAAWYDGYYKMADLPGVQTGTVAHAIDGLTFGAGYFSGETRSKMEQMAGNLLSPSIQADLAGIEKHWELAFRQATEVTEEKVFQFVYVGA